MSDSLDERQDSGVDIFLILKNFFYLFRRTFYFVILAAAALGALSGYRAYRSYSPYYQAEAVLSVSAGYSSSVDILNQTSYYDASATRQVISTFSEIINTDAMRELIQQELGSGSMAGSVTPEIIADSNLFRLTVTSGDPQAAYDTLMAVIKCYPKLASLVVGGTEITLLEEPSVPTQPVNSPSWRGAALHGAIRGGLLALLLIGLLAQLRQTIHSAEEMKRYSSLTCLSMVPAIPQRRRTNSSRGPSLLSGNLPAGYAESIRTLRTRLLHRTTGSGCQTILVTSTVPAEGKSTISANLALALAQAGSRVILVDADMRAESLHAFFGLRGKSRGLPELLASNDADPRACLTEVPGTTLRLLGSSTKVAAPSKLLRSARIQKILAVLRTEADYVIIDTPPIGLLADASAFVRLADGVVYVVREDFAHRGEILASLQSLADNHANLIGYVLNGTSHTANRYGYGSYGGSRRSGYDAYGAK